MIIDGFIFCNELDLLEMRFEELDPVVDKFVVVQASMDFRGRWKKKHFNKLEPRWERWRHKVIDFDIYFPPPLNFHNDPWEREAFQRDSIGRAVKHFANKSDFLIMSDVDEIPRRESIEQLKAMQPDGIVRLYTPMYYYGLNVRQGEWGAIRFTRVEALDYFTCQQLREHEPSTYLNDAGWHFSYLGDDEFVSNKIKSFSHSELDTPTVHANITRNRIKLLDPYNHGQQLVVEPFVLESMPHAVKNNPGKWSKYVWQ